MNLSTEGSWRLAKGAGTSSTEWKLDSSEQIQHIASSKDDWVSPSRLIFSTKPEIDSTADLNCAREVEFSGFPRPCSPSVLLSEDTTFLAISSSAFVPSLGMPCGHGVGKNDLAIGMDADRRSFAEIVSDPISKGYVRLEVRLIYNVIQTSLMAGSY